MTFVTKDSGARASFDSGMQRDTEEGKARFDLILAEGVPYEAQLLTRFAELMARGAKKYDPRNWEQASGSAELIRFRSSALRHLQQWAAGETDEDHAAAVMFNLLGHETTLYKIRQAATEDLAGCAICFGTGVQHCGMSKCRKDEGGAGSQCGEPCDHGVAMAAEIAATKVGCTIDEPHDVCMVHRADEPHDCWHMDCRGYRESLRDQNGRPLHAGHSEPACAYPDCEQHVVVVTGHATCTGCDVCVDQVGQRRPSDRLRPRA